MRLALLLLAAGLCLPELALAQEPETDASAEAENTAEAPAAEGEPTTEQLAEARQLFDDGLRYAGERLFGRAAIAFRRAAAIKAAPAVLYNLAAAQYELEELVEAGTNAQRVLEDEATPPELAERTQALLEQILPRVARLTVQTAGEANGATVDGERLEEAQLGETLFLEPGSHTVAGLRDGEAMTERTIEIVAGGQAHVDVTVVPSAEEVAAAAIEDDAEEEGGMTDRRRLGLILGFSGVLLVIVTAIVVFVASG